MITVSACSSNEPAPHSTASTFHSTASPRTSTSQVDQKAAKAAVLRQSDVGSAYQEKPYLPSFQAPHDDAIEQRCLGRPPSVTEQTAVAFSPEFTKGDARQVLASVTFVRSSAMATADLNALQSRKAPACLMKVFTMQLRRAQQATPRVVLMRIPFHLDTIAVCEYRFRATVRTVGGDLTQYFDLISAIRGRAEVQATFQDVNRPADHAFEEHVVNAMIQRL